MLAPHLKSKIDLLWNKFWTAGITNPLVAIEQITYLLFLKRLEGLDAKRIENGKKSIYDSSIYTDDLKSKIPFYQEPKGQKISKADYEKLRQELEKEFQKNLNQCKWSYIQIQKNNVNHLINIVFPWLRNLEEIFRSADSLDKKLSSIGNRMSDAYFQLDPNKGAILAEAIQLIDELFSNIDAASISDDIMGDTFEYLLSEVSSAGTNGQFRTPRHFIRMMVEILDPEPGMRCIDPASGTGGFIFSIISFLLQKYTDKDGIKIEWDGTPHRAIGDKLNPEQDKKLFDGKNYTGFDNDRTMVRIGWMNLLLHGIENPGIYQRDSLAKRKETDDLVQKHILSLLDSETYDRVAANPPFTGTIDTDDLDDKDIFPKAGESGGKSKVAITNKSELLFVWLMLDLLVVGGKCAVIVPEGVLFGSTDAHVALRRELLMEHQIEGIISLPGGSFQPYTGVKTSILIFQKETKKADKASAKDLRNKIPRTESVWFYEIEQECYSLDAKRTERKGQNNDLWDAVKKFKIRNEKNYDDLDYYQPTYSTERWRLADENLLKKYPDDKEVKLSQGKLANLSELFKLPGNGDPVIAEREIDKKQIPIIKDLIESILYNQPLNSEKSPDIEVLKKEITKKFRETFFFTMVRHASSDVAAHHDRGVIVSPSNYHNDKNGNSTKDQAKQENISYKSLFDKDDSKGRILYEKKVNEIFEVVRLANLSFDKLRMTENDSNDKDVIVSLSNYQNSSEEILKNLQGKKAKYKVEDYTGIAFKIAKEYAKLDGFDVTLRTQESFKQKEKLKTPKSWSSPVRKYLENPDWVSGKLKGSHDSKGNVRTEYVKSIRLYNDAGKLVDELNEKERKEFLETIPEEEKAFYNTALLDPDCIEAKGWNLSAGQYKPFVFSEAEDKILVSDRIKELQTDVAEVQTRLVKLLEMVK